MPGNHMPGTATGPVPSIDAVERRRIQNRIAQRKFRQKRSLKRKLEAANQAQQQAADQSDDPLLDLCNAPLDASFDFSDLNDVNIQFPTMLDTDQLSSAVEKPTPDVIRSFLPQPIGDSDLSNPSLSSRSSVHDNEDDASRGADWKTPVCAYLGRFPTHDVASQDDMSVTPYERTSPRRKRSGSVPSLEPWLTAVHIAAEKGHDRILGMLIDRGDFHVDDKDGEGKTALHYATLNEHESCVRVLLARGALVDKGDKVTGWTSLHWACMLKNKSILRLMLEQQPKPADFNINAFDINGWTSLHAAVAVGFEEGVTLLLNHGADLGFKARRCMITGCEVPRDVEDEVRGILLRTAESATDRPEAGISQKPVTVHHTGTRV